MKEGNALPMRLSQAGQGQKSTQVQAALVAILWKRRWFVGGSFGGAGGHPFGADSPVRRPSRQAPSPASRQHRVDPKNRFCPSGGQAAEAASQKRRSLPVADSKGTDASEQGLPRTVSAPFYRKLSCPLPEERPHQRGASAPYCGGLSADVPGWCPALPG